MGRLLLGGGECDLGRTGVALSGEHLKNRVALVEEDAKAAEAFGESFLSVERPQQTNSMTILKPS